MKTDKVYFHGKKDQIEKLEKIVEALPDGAVYNPFTNKVDDELDVELVIIGTAEIYPRHNGHPLAVRVPNKGTACFKYVDFEHKGFNYRIWYSREEKFGQS